MEKTTMYAMLEDNKVVGYTYESVPGSIMLTDEEYLRQISHHAVWLYDGGVFTPHPFPTTVPDEDETDDMAAAKKYWEEQNAIRELAKIQAKSLVATMAKEDVVKIQKLFDVWSINTPMKKGDFYTYKDVLYKVLQDHKSQAAWNPEVAVSLFAKVLTDPAGTPLPWVKPGSTNPYKKGDRVLWTDGKVYESTIDNNVWSPSEYPAGWKVV